MGLNEEYSRNEIINSSEQGALKIEKQLPCKNKKNSYTIWQQKTYEPYH